MSYIEKQHSGETYYGYFTKKISVKGESHVLRKHIGKMTSALSKEKFLLDNLDTLGQLEFDIRYPYISEISDKISFNSELPVKVEKKAIKISNIIEALRIEKIIYAEFATEFIFNSNNIEGSKIPKDKVLEIIEKGDTKYQRRNEVIEVKNSLKAYDYLLSGFKYNIPSVKRLYYILTDGLKMDNGEKYPRGFKKISNIVGNDPTSPPEEVEQQLKNLISSVSKTKKLRHPLIHAFDFHKQYEAIHPFLDGNGRTGRMIMNKILDSGGYFPMIIFCENKRAYFNVLKKGRQGSEKKYMHFMLEQMDKTYDLVLRILADTLSKSKMI